MFDTIFDGIFTSTTTTSITVPQFLLCILVSLLIGVFLAFIFTCQNATYTSSFVITLALLPAIVCVVILMVNGNVGTGVAVAGAFSLVRFRSAPGTAEEIAAIFLSMAAGLITGMGYLGYAAVFAVILGVIMLTLNKLATKRSKPASRDKNLRITIPEDLNYSEAFDDLFAAYTDKCEVISVKTSNMGSLFKLNYHITLKDPAKEKEFIDALRCRNGNLEISVSRQEVNQYEL